MHAFRASLRPDAGLASYVQGLQRRRGSEEAETKVGVFDECWRSARDPGFDEMVHRFGAKAVMSRRPFLPIALRVPLLAGVAIVMRDPAQTISRLRTSTPSDGNQRFTEIEADLGAGSANPVSHRQLT